MKISLAINSKDPLTEWMNELIASALSFDEVVVYIDGQKPHDVNISQHVLIVGDGESRDIKDGFNYVISRASGEWICSFCDDDYFIPDALQKLINAIKKEGFGDNADIIHFPVMTGSGSWGQVGEFNENQIRECNLIPHGSLIRKEAFQKLGGYKVNAAADWNLWIRAKAAGLRFKGWPEPIYFFRMGHSRSAWCKQVHEYGSDKIKELVNATV